MKQINFYRPEKILAGYRIYMHDDEYEEFIQLSKDEKAEYLKDRIDTSKHEGSELVKAKPVSNATLIDDDGLSQRVV